MNSRRWLRRILDGLILTLVGWLLLTAAYVSLGRQFVPAVADYQTELLAKTEQLTGRAILLDSLQGSMQGAQPVLTMRGLQVHAGAQQDSPVLFALDHVTARIDVFASLWQRRLVMDALQIEGLELELAEDAQGHWRVHGLSPANDPQANLQEALETLFDQRRITLLKTRIRISPYSLPDWVFSNGELTLLNGPGWHRLDGQVSLPDGQQLRWQLSGLLPDNDWQRLSVGFFVELPASDWSQWLPPEWLSRARITHLQAGVQLWGNWDKQRLQQMQGILVAPEMALAGERSGPAIQDLSAMFELRLEQDRQQLQVEGLSLRLDEQVWPSTRLQASRRLQDGHWQLDIDQLPLARVAQWLPGLLDNQQLVEVIDTLSPQGFLRDIRLSGSDDLKDLGALTLQAALDQVSVQAWDGVPAFSAVSGSLEGGPLAGELRVDSRQAAMHLPKLFPEAWSFDRLTGSMTWSWSADEGLRLLAPAIAASAEEGKANARLALHIPPPGGTPVMDLRVALRDSQAGFHSRYLPTRSPAMPQQVVEWLADSRLSGDVPLAIFSYQGSLLSRAEPDERQIDLYAQLENGQLLFQPGWPALEAVSGTLRLRDSQLDIAPASARLRSTELASVSVATRQSESGAAPELLIQGDFSGPMEDALFIMQGTPLTELTGDPLAGWRGRGRVQGKLALAIPLRAGAEPGVRLDWQATLEELLIPELQAPLTALNGRFAYEHAGKGLQASDVSLRFLGQPVSAEIDSPNGSPRLRMTGTHSVESLHGWPLLDIMPEGLASGHFDWQAQLLLSQGSQHLQVKSDLQGVSLALPGALAKSAASRLPSELNLELSSVLQRWQFKVGSDIQGVLHSQNGELAGDLRYRRGTALTPIWKGLSISAGFDEFDWNEWQQWLSRHTAAASESPGSPATPLIQRLNLTAGRFVGFGMDVDNLVVSGTHAPGGWLLDVEQTDIKGRIRLPDASGQPISLELERLRFPRADKLPEGSALATPLVPQDPLEGITPSSLPALDIKIDQVFWGDSLVGATAFNLRPSTSGARISDIHLGLRGGLRLQGAMDWRDSASRTHFVGQLGADDIGAVLRAWDYAPTLTSERFEANIDLDWPGSPAFFALSRSSGQLQLKATRGMLQSGEGSAEALRVFGLLNFNALARRLRLDFSDLFGRGTAYDTLDGDLGLSNGVMRTRSPLVMDGPSAKLQLDGAVNLPEKSIDMGMLLTLPVTNNLPLAAIIAGAPYIGGALFLVDRILGDRVARFASVKYKISGDWQQPTVEFDRAFDNKAALEEN